MYLRVQCFSTAQVERFVLLTLGGALEGPTMGFMTLERASLTYEGRLAAKTVLFVDVIAE